MHIAFPLFARVVYLRYYCKFLDNLKYILTTVKESSYIIYKLIDVNRLRIRLELVSTPNE